MAGGSQIIINSDGITIITPREFKVHAGQHIFKSGEKVKYNLPELPNIKYLYSNKLDVFDLFKDFNFSEVEYSVLYPSGQVKKGVLDKYGRTERIKSHEKDKVKVLIGGSDWYYYASELGGSKLDEVRIKFIDFLGRNIPKLKVQVKSEYGKPVIDTYTDNNGEISFISLSDELPALYVQNLITNEMKLIARINNDNIRELILISPKVMEEVSLLPESEEKGDYLRGGYSTESDDLI